MSEHQREDVSAQTVRNSLKKVGLKGSVKVKKPLLAKRHIQQRLAFCKNYKNWTVEDWKCVIGQISAKSIGWDQVSANGTGS